MFKTIRTTIRCNQNCVFCNVNDKTHPSFSEPSISMLKRQISNLDRSRYEGITISGGEPTLRKNLFEVIGFAKKEGLDTVLQSNCMMMSYPEYANNLKKAGLGRCIASLHSHDEAVSDAMTRTPSGFKKSIAGIHNLISSGIEVEVNVVINRSNYERLVEYVDFIREEFDNGAEITFSVVQPRGNAWSNRNVIPRLSVLEKHLMDVLGYCEDAGVRFRLTDCSVPFCFMGKYIKHSTEFNSVTDGFEKENRTLFKTKTKQCSECILDKRCSGIWKNYVRLFGDDEVKPIRS